MIKRAQGRNRFGMKNFKKRWFRLTNHEFTYHKTKGEVSKFPGRISSRFLVSLRLGVRSCLTQRRRERECAEHARSSLSTCGADNSVEKLEILKNRTCKRHDIIRLKKI